VREGGKLICHQLFTLPGRSKVVRYFVPLTEGGQVMSITASEARKALFPLIKQVNDDHEAIEIVSKHGNAVLVSSEDYAALREGSYLLRSPANARRLLKAYENALANINVSERDLIDPDSADAGTGAA
jgi:antitoxin YefM